MRPNTKFVIYEYFLLVKLIVYCLGKLFCIKRKQWSCRDCSRTARPLLVRSTFSMEYCTYIFFPFVLLRSKPGTNMGWPLIPFVWFVLLLKIVSITVCWKPCMYICRNLLFFYFCCYFRSAAHIIYRTSGAPSIFLTMVLQLYIFFKFCVLYILEHR